MAISIQVEPGTGMAIVAGSGVLGIDEAREAAASLWNTSGWKGISAVWDLRAAQFDLTSSDVREVARFILKHQPATPPSRVAFVTQRDADFGMARMFEVYREDPATAFRVFRDYDEAVRWARLAEPDTA